MTFRSKTADQVFTFIKHYKAAHDGISPTRREIMSALNLSSTSVVEYNLRKLERQGRVRLGESGCPRNIRVIGGQWSFGTSQGAAP
jgi:SOS-response transcriptional repressor LexA